MVIKEFLRRHMLSFGWTLTLILVEALLTLLFPLFIGYAVDDAMNQTYNGLMHLGTLGLAVLIVGAGRRFFDSRHYAKAYQKIGSVFITNQPDHSTSKKAARLGMIKELVEFLEFSLPEMINAAITLVGVLAILATLEIHVFMGALLASSLIFIVYWVSSAKTLGLNKAANDEQEKEVEVIAKNDTNELGTHLRSMMQWNIKLSDLEVVNFSVTWLILMVFLLTSIFLSVDGQAIQYGILFSMVMYVFQYIESVMNIPFFYQSWLRLQEISSRIALN